MSALSGKVTSDLIKEMTKKQRCRSAPRSVKTRVTLKQAPLHLAVRAVREEYLEDNLH